MACSHIRVSVDNIGPQTIYRCIDCKIWLKPKPYDFNAMKPSDAFKSHFEWEELN